MRSVRKKLDINMRVLTLRWAGGLLAGKGLVVFEQAIQFFLFLAYVLLENFACKKPPKDFLNFGGSFIFAFELLLDG